MGGQGWWSSAQYLNLYYENANFIPYNKKKVIDSKSVLFQDQGKIILLSVCSAPTPPWLSMCSVGKSVIYKVAWDVEKPVIRGIEYFQTFLLLEGGMGKLIPKGYLSGHSGKTGGRIGKNEMKMG